jgi:peroxiredoxin Q/BCP
MKKNDLIADFSATDQNGKVQSLTGLLASGPLVLFFYPKAMTPG